jgi:DNA polymerase I
MIGLFDELPGQVVPNWQPEQPVSLAGCDIVGFDTETNGLKWFLKDRPIGISVYRPGEERGRYFPWGHRAGGNLSEETVKQWAKRELRGKKLIGANIKFDIHMMREWGVDLEDQGCTAVDVQHMAALLDDHRRQFKLDLLLQEFLHRRKVGHDLDGKRLWEYHASIIEPRAQADAQDAYELYVLFLEEIKKQELERVFALECNVIWPTVMCEYNAAPIDMELLDRWVNRSEIAYTTALLDVHKEVGFVVNPRSRDDMVRLFNQRKVPIIHFTENGNPSFDDQVLKAIDDPIIKKIRYASKIQSLRSKFLVAYQEAIGGDGKLRYSLHQLRSDDGGTISGRFSASDKNIQQVMHPGKQRMAFGFDEKDETHDDEIFLIRQLFIPEFPDRLFLDADAKQVEYRCFAHYSASPKILKVYRENPDADFHNTVRDMILIVREITRKRTKDVNFAFVFGAGKDKIAAMLELPLQESNKVVEAYHEAFPEAKQLMKRAMRIARDRGYVKTITGRRSRFPDGQRLHKALNAVIQGTAADIAKQKSVELHAERKRTDFIFRFPVHDSAAGDVPDQESARMVDEILNRQSFEMNVKILWDVKTGRNWKEC